MTAENGGALSGDPKQERTINDDSGTSHQTEHPKGHHNQTVSVVVSSTPQDGATKKDKRHWLDHAAVVIAGLAFFAACIAAGFSWYQGWVARDTEKRQLRAYLIVTEARFDQDDSG